MSQRDDISVRWDLSPRLITIAAPSVELTIQDLHDTLREIEARIENNIYPSIISTAGGENLGGSTTVGLTATLINACVSFEARTESVADGYATAIDVTGTVLTDSSASYITDGVATGAAIINFDDLSVATVVQVISETQLELTALDDGDTDAWTIGDYYKLWNQVSATITGGNLVAVDELDADINPVCPTAFVQVTRTSASSATATFSQDIEFASFNGGVTVDINNITGLNGSGTNFPAGTIRQPCDNFADALLIAGERGFDRLFIKGNATIDSGLDYDNITFEGTSPSRTTLIIDAAASVLGCEFEHATISGILDGYSTINRCNVDSLSFFDGFITESGIIGTITLSGDREAHIIDCHSGVPGSDTPTIDMGGSGQSLLLRNYNGGVKLINKTGNDDVSIDLNSGQIILDSTYVANGETVLRGIGKLTDNSTDGTGAINSDDLISGRDLTILNERLARRIEDLRGTHQALGQDFYVDPFLGDDTNDGKLTTSAFKTFAVAHNAASSGDVIWLHNSTAAATVLTEFITITKNRLRIRGPGLNFIIQAPNDGYDIITVDGGGTELHGFQLRGTNTGTPRRGIYHTGKNHLRVEQLQMQFITSHGIESDGGDKHRIFNVEINEPDGYGIQFNDTTRSLIKDCKITNAVEGIRYTSPSGVGSSSSNEVQHTHFEHATAAGVNIGADVDSTVIREDCIFHGDAVDTIDNGIDTHIEHTEREDSQGSNTFRRVFPFTYGAK